MSFLIAHSLEVDDVPEGDISPLAKWNYPLYSEKMTLLLNTNIASDKKIKTISLSFQTTFPKTFPISPNLFP